MALDDGSAQADSSTASSSKLPSDVLSLLTDVHAHPTDDPRLTGSGGVALLARRLAQEVRIGRMCAVGSNTADQSLVKELKREFQSLQQNEGLGTGLDLRACFGYHPWYSHTISLEHPAPSAEHHYRSLFLSHESSQTTRDEVESLLPHLPKPRSLQDILSEVRCHLELFPDAMLGEVGLDRAFRVPASRSAIKEHQTSERELLASEPQRADHHEETGCNSHTLALRGKSLTSLTIPISHQHQVLMEQIGIAVQLSRNVSLHSVRAPEATVNLFKEACRVYSGINGTSFRDINIDLHSCTLSSQVVLQQMTLHPNVFASFSTTINASKSQKSFPSLLLLIPPTRLLIESDWHTSSDLTERNGDILKIVAPFVVRRQFQEVNTGEDGSNSEAANASESLYRSAAQVLQRTWNRFERNEAVKRRARESGDADYDEDAEDAEDEQVRQFEEQWFKDVKIWQSNQSSKARKR